MITEKDRAILRRLAAKQMEIAHSEINLKRVEEWKRHNAFKGDRPMIHIELDTFEEEMLGPLLCCTDPVARKLEKDLYRNFFNLTEFDDDWVVPDYFGIDRTAYFRPFGYEITATTATDSNGGHLGHRFNYIIDDLEDDFDKLKRPSEYGVLDEQNAEYKKIAEDTFGDILPVRMTMGSLVAVPTQQVVHLMGMETMCYSLYDYPELFKEMMNRLADDYIAFFKYLETNGYLLPTTGFELLNQGSKCFTDELPSKGPLTTKDLWGFMDSQETVSISPDQFREFIYPCYKKIAGTFGLLSYGCCEPVSAVWDIVKNLPNLRKVSISPWCDEAYMAQQLRGSKIIYHRKPSPNYLGIGTTLDEDAFRKHIRTTLETAQGCKVEITQRDVYTVNHDLAKVRRYVQIIREEIAEHWKG